jgi:DNA-binding CsgD family transcriptional regulator
MTVMGLATPLERAAEIEQLSALLVAARDGRGQVCVVEGPSGVGKSRLLDESASSAAALGMCTLRVWCSELTRDFQFGVARSMFGAESMRADAETRAMALRGPAALAEPLFGCGEATDEFAVIHGLYWLTLNLAEQRPIAIIVDDVPWADDLSLRFLAYLAERLEDAPVALVVAIRSGDTGADSPLIGYLWNAASSPPIRPRELSAAGVQELLAAALPGHDVADELVQTVMRDTGGNPLLVMAVADAVRAGENPELTTPASVRRHIARRLARLNPCAREFAKAASVLGDGAALDDVVRLARLQRDQGLAGAEQLVVADVLASADPIMFAHAVVGTAIYRVLSPVERPALHARCAELLAARRAEPEVVAEHLLLSSSIHEPWAMAALHDAGRAAARKGAPTAAMRYLRRAIDGPDGSGQQARVLIDLGLAEAAAGQPTSLNRFEHALDLVNEPDERADALYSLGQTLHRFGRYAEAAVAFRRGAELFDSADRQVRQRFEGAAWGAEFHLEPVNRGPVSGVDTDGRSDGPGDRALLAFQALRDSQTRPPAARGADLALRALGGGALLAEQTAEGPSVNLPTLALLHTGRLIEANESADATVRDARQRGGLLAFAEASLVRAVVLYARGRVTDAAVDAQAAWDRMRSSSHGNAHTALGTLVLCMIDRGELEAAASLMDQATELLAPPETPAIRAYRFTARGRLHFKRNDLGAARRDLELAEDAMRAYGTLNPAVVHWRSLAGVVAHLCGDVGHGRQLIDEEIRLAYLFESPISLGIALHRRALTETGDTAIATCQEAVTVLEETDAKLELARAYAGLGFGLRRAGQRVQARSRLGIARDLAHQCGAMGLEAEIVEELTAAGARPRRRAITGVEALTATELRVARMAAEGLANREIAELMFLSRNTIAWHLRNVYRKLQVESRDQVKLRIETEALP